MNPSNSILGIICIMIGMGTSSLMDATIKSLSGVYPLHEIVMARSVVAILLTLIIVHFEGGLALLKTSRPFMHLMRGVLIVIANMTFYLAISAMPLAEATAIFFVSPLIITVLSVFVLGESVGWRRWLGVLAGFIGVVIIVNPGAGSFSYFSLLPVIAALAYATTQITSRNLGITEKASVMSFYIGLTFIFISSGFWLLVGDGSYVEAGGEELNFLFRPWVWPTPDDAVRMVLIGVLVAIVGYMLSQAYRVANASVVAPFEFIAMPLSILWGYLFWQEIPGIQAAIGIALIFASGLYVFLRENRTTGLVDETYGIDASEEEIN
jgi:S-adenosylmethionine uptake transporter